MEPDRAKLLELIDRLITVRREGLETLERIRDVLANGSAEAIQGVLSSALDFLPDDESGMSHEESTPPSSPPAPPPPGSPSALPVADGITNVSADTRVDPESSRETSLLVLVGPRGAIGFPWSRVAQVCLEEEIEDRPLVRHSLLALGGGNGSFPWAEEEAGGSLAGFFVGSSVGEEAEEPFAVIWRSDRGEEAITCAEIRGIVPVSAAAGVGIDEVVDPSGSSDQDPKIVPVLEFLACQSRRVVTLDASPIQASDPEDRSPANGIEPTDAAEHAELATTSESVEPADVATPTEAVELADVAAPAEAVELADAATPADAAEPVDDSAPADAAAPADDSAPADAAVPADTAVAAATAQTSVPNALALIAVNYLPARIMLARSLRTRGWRPLEEADPSRVDEHADRHPRLVFLELSKRTGELPESFTAEEGGSTPFLIGVASRLRIGEIAESGPLATAPRLLFPFTDADLDDVLGPLRPAGCDSAPKI